MTPATNIKISIKEKGMSSTCIVIFSETINKNVPNAKKTMPATNMARPLSRIFLQTQALLSDSSEIIYELRIAIRNITFTRFPF